jgi:penicillin-binding protein 2
VRSLSRTRRFPGNNLTLTLDAKLQEITEQAFGDRKGALVAIEPSTGGILALVFRRRPYDPNLFVDGITTEDWKELNDSPDKPMVNRAINGAYPPGSTFKPFMALAALKWASARPEQAIADPGFSTSAATFRDDKKGGHGMRRHVQVDRHSCDTYYYMLANDMGIDNIARFMGSARFWPAHRDRHRGRIEGRAAVAGVEEAALQEARAAKVVRRRNDLDRHRPGLQRLHADPAGAGDGHLANNGVMFRPHLVKYITDAKTGEKDDDRAEPLRDSASSAATSR